MSAVVVYVWVYLFTWRLLTASGVLSNVLWRVVCIFVVYNTILYVCFRCAFDICNCSSSFLSVNAQVCMWVCLMNLRRVGSAVSWFVAYLYKFAVSLLNTFIFTCTLPTTHRFALSMAALSRNFTCSSKTARYFYFSAYFLLLLLDQHICICICTHICISLYIYVYKYLLLVSLLFILLSAVWRRCHHWCLMAVVLKSALIVPIMIIELNVF